MKYLPVSVYTSGRDCTNGGVTHTHSDNIVVPMEDGYLSLDDVTERGYAILELEASALRGAPPHFKPEGEKRWTMFGGNYVSTSDSRFKRKYGYSPIAVHDRIEG